MKKQNKLIIYVTILTVIMLFAGCGNGDSSSTSKSNKKSNLYKSNSNIIQASGVVKSSNAENIVLDFPAEVTKVYCNEGQKVKKGESLISLNMQEITNEINSKNSELDSENLEVKNSQRDKEALDKNSEAVQVQGSSENPWLDKDDLKYKEDNTVAMLKDKIAITQSELNTLKDKINKSYINGTNIICNMNNAVVTDIGYKAGDVVNSSQKVLTLFDMDNLYIEAKVDEEFSNELQLGKSVVIKPEADSSKKYTGKVISIPSSATTSNGETYLLVGISIENKDNFLIPNYNVDLEITRK